MRASSAYLSCSMSLLLFGSSFFAHLSIFRYFRRLQIHDVSLSDDRLVITTFGSHSIRTHNRKKMVKVALAGTGHPFLNASCEYCVKIMDSHHLELMSSNGDPINRNINASKGHLGLKGSQSFWLTGSILPRCLLLPGLMVATLLVIFLGDLSAPAAIVAIAAGALLASIAFGATMLWYLKSKTLAQQTIARYLHQQPKLVLCNRGPDRGVTIEKLTSFYVFFVDFIRDRDTYYLSENIITFLTARNRVSFAELVGPNQMHWFVSHFWGDAFRHLIRSLQKHTQEGTTSYWICSFANNQWDIATELGGEGDNSWQSSSFYLALKCNTNHGTLMVITQEVNPLTRIWCLFEVVQTLLLCDANAAYQGLLFGTESGILNFGHAGSETALAVAKRIKILNLSDAMASNQKDKDMIFSLIASMPGGLASVTGFVRKALREALVSMRQNLDKDFDVLTAWLDTADCTEERRTQLAPELERALHTAATVSQRTQRAALHDTSSMASPKELLDSDGTPVPAEAVVANSPSADILGNSEGTTSINIVSL